MRESARFQELVLKGSGLHENYSMLPSPYVGARIRESLRHTRYESRHSTLRFSAVLVCFAPLLLSSGCANFVITGGSPSSPPPSGPPAAPTQNGTVTLTPQYVALSPGQSFKFVAKANNGGAITWSVNTGTVDGSGNYTAPDSITQSENVIVTAALAASPQKDYATAIVAVIQPGQVRCPSVTGNPQVAQYSIYLPAGGRASVQFGTTTNYGLTTWSVPTPTSNGGQVQIWVAGMLGQTLYHLRAQIELTNGATFADSDQTCTTGRPPVTSPFKIFTSGTGTPQSGIELWNTILPASFAQAVATDLDGNVIWTYSYHHNAQDSIQGFQLLPNGDFLLLITYLSSLNPSSPGSLIDEVREIDLAGNTIRSLTIDSLNQKMAASDMRDAEGNSYQFKSFHHDVLILPNGHWVLLTCYNKAYANLPGSAANTEVLGDALVDVDENGNPDWAWNTFDHLNVNRHPMNFPDWTHANGMLYSSDDHNLLLSMRHQNWIIKIEFLDGSGSGKVMWHVGFGGDFRLVDGNDPTDWFYAQHGMNYFTLNTTGVFRLGLMDNGNDRIFPTGQVHCAPVSSIPPTCYSTVPVLEINENAMTATLVAHYIPPPSYFSFFGGNAELLANGDIETDFAATNAGAIVQELDPNTLALVWEATTPSAFQYHANRIPSLYPAVQW
jgi:arylsulfate sulfotransferase